MREAYTLAPRSALSRPSTRDGSHGDTLARAMDRQPPRVSSDEIELYVRTYYSLLRSSGEVRVRAFEEAHIFSKSSLHLGAADAAPDVAAFAYSAARLPACMPQVQRVLLGQSHEQFERAGLEVRSWQRVRSRGRRRPLRFDGKSTLAAFITSTSDIDDLVPILTAYQIEWNKLHRRLVDDRALGLDEHDQRTLDAALGEERVTGIAEIGKRESDLSLRLLAGSFVQYQRASQRWWSDIERAYVRDERPRRRPVYFVSSNTHAVLNLFGGYARHHRPQIIDFVRKRDPEGLAATLDATLATDDSAQVDNLLYYVMRHYLHEGQDRVAEVRAHDRLAGVRAVESPGGVDVDAQIVELAALSPAALDPRVRVAGVELLAKSNALILNIDYPLGVAAYHHLSRAVQGIGELRGIYVMGKAATLNARVGDVLISKTAHDEHSRNTYLFRNGFTAADVQPFLRRATVLDNQKALTVRGPFLQNRDYMSGFYREGYTVLEMEAGPYLSAVYEIINPGRHPEDEIVQLANLGGLDLGILHYASDTPYSRRQSLLSKSLSYFGVEATYGCAIAIARRILIDAVARVGA